jgi:hypothetical protein
MGKRDRERKERIRNGLEIPIRERMEELQEELQSEAMLCSCCDKPMTPTFLTCPHCESETRLIADYDDELDDEVHTARCPGCGCIFCDDAVVAPDPECQARLAEPSVSSRELWERACEYFPDEVEDTVIALAEKEQVRWGRIPGFNGLQFWYQSAEHMERFRGAMSEIGQVLDDSHC